MVAERECAAKRAYWVQLHELEKGMDVLTRAGLGPGTAPYETLWGQRGGILAKAQAAAPSPRIAPQIAYAGVAGRVRELGLTFIAASPKLTIEELEDALIRVYFDIEAGWFAEARMSEEAAPTYKQLTGEEAVLLIKNEAPPELLARLLEPETYFGE